MKKFISTLVAVVLFCSMVTPLSTNAVVVIDNDGKEHHCIQCRIYSSNNPKSETTTYSAECIKRRYIIYKGTTLGMLRCMYNKELIGYNYSQAQISPSVHGYYYDCSVCCQDSDGGWVSYSPTKRSYGTSTKWIYDNNTHTRWVGCVYWS